MSLKKKLGNVEYLRIMFQLKIYLEPNEFRMFGDVEKLAERRPEFDMQSEQVQKLLCELAAMRKLRGGRPMKASEIAQHLS